MVKFVAGPGKKNCVIGLGLSEKNVQRIRAGEPITIDFLELGLPWQGKIVIFHGETELKMMQGLKEAGFITDQTEQHIDPKLS